MSIRKKLLTEGEFRRFMKLANMGPVGDQRLSEIGYGPQEVHEEDEEELKSKLHATEDELGAEDHEADMEDDELAVDDMALDDEGPIEGGEEDLVVSLLQAIQGWAEEHGVDMDLEGGEEEVDMDDLEMDVEMPMDDGGEEEVGMDVMDVEEEPGMRDGGVYQERKKGGKDWHATGKKKGQKDAEDTGEDYTWRKGKKSKTHAGLNRESKVVEEVAKRVLARLQADKNKEKVVDELAERIMKRLTQ